MLCLLRSPRMTSFREEGASNKQRDELYLKRHTSGDGLERDDSRLTSVANRAIDARLTGGTESPFPGLALSSEFKRRICGALDRSMAWISTFYASADNRNQRITKPEPHTLNDCIGISKCGVGLREGRHRHLRRLAETIFVLANQRS